MDINITPFVIDYIKCLKQGLLRLHPFIFYMVHKLNYQNFQ
jgi:hypothetical protein